MLWSTLNITSQTSVWHYTHFVQTMFDVRLITSIKSFVLKYNYLKFETFFDESFAMTSTDCYIFILQWMCLIFKWHKIFRWLFLFLKRTCFVFFCNLCNLYFLYLIRFQFELDIFQWMIQLKITICCFLFRTKFTPTL